MLVYGKCFPMQMLYVCVHHVEVVNATFCMTGSLLMLVEEARDDHMAVVRVCVYLVASM